MIAMSRLPFFLRWLALAALTDWLVTRTLARLAIFMPKSPPVLTAYQVIVAAGQVASVLAALLALAGMLWLAIQVRPVFKGGLSLALLSLVCISLVLQVVVPGALLQLTYHVLILGVVLGVLIYALRWEASLPHKVVVVLSGLAILSGGLFQTIQVWSQALGWSKPPEFTLALFNLGEGLVVLCPAAVWWVQRWRSDPSVGQRLLTYLWAAIPALGFSALTVLNPAMAGILSIWSTGLTLFLPWPIYALSLWVLGVIVIATWRSGESTGMALLLLAAGGYAPQLSSQAFFGLIGLMLLCRSLPRAARLNRAVQMSMLPHES